MKKPRVRPEPNAKILSLLDEAEIVGRNIATIAGLLEAAGRWHQKDALELELVSDTGTLLGREARRLDELMRAVRQRV